MAAYAALMMLAVASVGIEAQPRLVEIADIPAGGPVTRVHASQGGRLYFAAAQTSEIGWTDAGRTYRTGGTGWDLNGLDEPRSIWSDGLSIYVADRGNNRIMRYDRELRPISSFATRDTSYAPARFGYPTGVAVNGRGDMGVLDGESGELVVFDHSGRFLFRYGRDPGRGRSFVHPSDVAAGSRGHWFVADERGLTEIDPFGSLVRTEGTRAGALTAVDVSNEWVVTATADTVTVYDREFRRQMPFAVSVFNLTDPQARLDDVCLRGNRLLLVLHGRIVEYGMEGFQQ